MRLRPIPFFTKEELKEYRNFEDSGNVLAQDVILELKPEYNMQLYPYFKVEAKQGQKIAISNNREFNNINEYGKIDYIAKDGVQEFESPAWISGENIYYFLPAGTRIISLGYYKTGYKIEKYGEFYSSDKDLTTLWDMSKKTLEVNMRDNYMDCPDRERALWMADLSIEMEEAIYSLDKNANSLYEKAINTFLGWKENGIFNTVPSSIIANQHMPIQNLIAIVSIYNYYEYTGYSNIVKDTYPEVRDYIRNNWTITNEGKVLPNSSLEHNLNEWYGATNDPDKELEDVVWFYYAYSTFGKMADLCLDSKEATEINDVCNEIKHFININYWDGNGFKSKGHSEYSTRANAVAVISGLAEEDRYEQITKILVENYDNLPFMERYPLEALCIMGKQDEAIARMKTLYKDMIEDKDNNSTLWEYWDKDEGTKNHAWSGSPLMIMSKYIAGIQPNAPAFRKVFIKPYFGDQEEIHAIVNTVSGKVLLNGKKSEDNLYVVIDVPSETIVAIEKLSSNPKILVNGSQLNDDLNLSIIDGIKAVKQDEKYIYYQVDMGQYIFVSKK